MPPRKNIVKSGNAGNSSKPKEKTAKDAAVPSDENKPLFPPGSKYPLSLLMERCQKNGWEKPIVDTPRKGDGYSFVVTLKRINKKADLGMDSVRLEPHPPYICPSAIEARHWGATYALYRFCNGIQLNRVLPQGPRDYWNQLAAEHKQSPDHQSWMYEADPFAARKAVDERQAKAAKRQEDKIQRAQDPQRGSSSVLNEFSKCPEVRMAATLRDLVEQCVKKGIALYPEANDTSATLTEESTERILSQLKTLGFNSQQARKAIDFLSQPSSLKTNLLASSSPLDASIEYLVLDLPECDLPARFLPSNNSSNPFITSGHSGSEDLKQRWIKDKAVKEAGWPARAVQDCASDERLVQSFDLLIAALGQRLIGKNVESVLAADNDAEIYTITEDEYTALGAHLEDPSHLIMPLFSAPIQLHILISPNRSPARGFIPMYLTSTSIPAYVRLHLLSRLLQEIGDEVFVANDEGLCMAAMRILEDEWAIVEDKGPPDVSEVLRYILPSLDTASDHVNVDEEDTPVPMVSRARRQKNDRSDKRTDQEVKEEFEALRRNNKYVELLDVRKRLPAFKARDAFLEHLNSSRVVVVVGETGSGKTTQLPQFILDSLILSGSGSKASILITQPRRISAISVSERVHVERLKDGSVGYAIRGESKYDPTRTKLLFCTTGVVLRRLSGGDKLRNVTHIVVDEVHERSVDCDFLLLELRELLKSHPSLKIVLMSATINYDIFSRYFDGAPLLMIPGFTHPITDMYLEDIIPMIGYRPQGGKQSKKDKDVDDEDRLQELKAKNDLNDDDIRSIQAVSRNDRLDYQLILAMIDHIMDSEKPAAILIFLSGIQEIRQCIETIRSSIPSASAEVLPLHSSLSSEEQLRVFAPTKKWKIIAATNVAETSITIDDVVYVIDTGKVKENSFNPDSGISTLKEIWVTKAAARQRRGRAGRTKPGKCFKLYTKKKEAAMSDFPTPEMLRVSLENVLLAVKVMREDEDIESYLGRAIAPPRASAIQKALATLEDLGALGVDGSLTSMGRHMSTLSVDVRLAKMLVLGTVFQCIDPILTIAAILSSKSLFLNPLEQREEASRARAKFATGRSDLLSDVKAYNEVMSFRAAGNSQSQVKRYCDEHFISSATIRDITTLRHEFIAALADIGFIPFRATPSDPAIHVNSENVNMVKAIITGGLWPRVARVHLPTSAIKFDKVQSGTVQRDNMAKEFRFYDLKGERAYLHPSSVLFTTSAWKSPFVAYFQQHMTTKSFLRGVTEVPVYGLLLFGGTVSVNHIAGGVTIRSTEGSIKLKAWPRIGVLVNQLRRLLDVKLQQCVEEGTMLSFGKDNPVAVAMLALLDNDGSTEM